MAFTQVTVNGEFPGVGGVGPGVGSVSFELRTLLTDTGSGLSLAPFSRTVQLDANGAFSTVLPANDDGTTSPTGSQYLVTTLVNGQRRSFFVSVPRAQAAGFDLNLATISTLPNVVIEQGATGPQGPAGPTGATGATGPAGTNGVDGAIARIRDEGTALTVRPDLNFVGAGVTAADDSANGRTNVTIPGAAATQAADEGTLLTVRPVFNFIGAGVTAADNSGANRTDITIPGSTVTDPPTLSVVKGTSTSRASTTTQTADPALLFAMGANELWVAHFDIIKVGSSISWSFQAPAGATGLQTNVFSIEADIISVVSATNGTGYPGKFRIEVAVQTASTAGNLVFMWSQATSSATAMVVRKGSRIDAWNRT